MDNEEEITLESLKLGQLDKIGKVAAKKSKKGKELDEIEQAAYDFAAEQKEKKFKCTIDEAFVIQRMVKKHKQNYEAMKKDLKLNKFMWTSQFCENRAIAFKEVYPDGV